MAQRWLPFTLLIATKLYFFFVHCIFFFFVLWMYYVLLRRAGQTEGFHAGRQWLQSCLASLLGTHSSRFRSLVLTAPSGGPGSNAEGKPHILQVVTIGWTRTFLDARSNVSDPAAKTFIPENKNSFRCCANATLSRRGAVKQRAARGTWIHVHHLLPRSVMGSDATLWGMHPSQHAPCPIMLIINPIMHL